MKTCEVCGETNGRIIKSKRYGKILCKKHYGQFERNGCALEYTMYDRNEINIQDDHAELILKDKYGEIVGIAIIDIDNVEIISKHKWHLKKNCNYASTEEKGKTILLHRFIIDAKEDDVVDHIDRNRLNCMKENLRIVNMSENAKNRGIRNDNSSGVTGVGWSEQKNKWVAYIYYDNKHMYLGAFDNKEEAIIQRLKTENKYFGEFAPQKHLFEEYDIREDDAE